jgi:hypothetical protein
LIQHVVITYNERGKRGENLIWSLYELESEIYFQI